tara:strand:+ start:312 stop:638 length:327 start_codon:yes stop_codon:yes gene_type:complete
MNLKKLFDIAAGQARHLTGQAKLGKGGGMSAIKAIASSAKAGWENYRKNLKSLQISPKAAYDALTPKPKKKEDEKKVTTKKDLTINKTSSKKKPGNKTDYSGPGDANI